MEWNEKTLHAIMVAWEMREQPTTDKSEVYVSVHVYCSQSKVSPFLRSIYTSAYRSERYNA